MPAGSLARRLGLCQHKTSKVLGITLLSKPVLLLGSTVSTSGSIPTPDIQHLTSTLWSHFCSFPHLVNHHVLWIIHLYREKKKGGEIYGLKRFTRHINQMYGPRVGSKSNKL